MATLAALCLLLSTLHFGGSAERGNRPHGFVHWHLPATATVAATATEGDGDAPVDHRHEDSPAKKRRDGALSVARDADDASSPLPFHHLLARTDLGHEVASLASRVPTAVAIAGGSPPAPSLRLNRGQAPPRT